MGLEIYMRLVCDECQNASEDFDGAIFSTKMMLAELRTAGWERRRDCRTHNAGTLCPRCSGKAAA